MHAAAAKAPALAAVPCPALGACLVAHRARLQQRLAAQRAERLVAVHQVDALAQADEAQQPERAHKRRQRALCVDGAAVQVVDLGALGSARIAQRQRLAGGTGEAVHTCVCARRCGEPTVDAAAAASLLHLLSLLPLPPARLLCVCGCSALRGRSLARLEPVGQVPHAAAIAVGVRHHHHLRERRARQGTATTRVRGQVVTHCCCCSRAPHHCFSAAASLPPLPLQYDARRCR